LNKLIVFSVLFFSCANVKKIKSESKVIKEIEANNNLVADTLLKYSTPEVVLNVMDFGAIPNDNKDDSEAIQKAINVAITNTKASKVIIPSGIFDLDKGIVIARLQADGEYFFNTITISGHVVAFTPIQSIGMTTVLNVRHRGFGFAFQLARQCVVENIAFLGCAKYNMTAANIINNTEEDWGEKGNQNIGVFAPSCAIAIDAFHSNVPKSERYADAQKYYTNKGTGGTSMLTIRGCAFERFYIAIANNPSANVANGDNIRAETCHVAFCHTFWSCGQTQSRANSIDNVYAIIIHTFINGRQIGQQYGTPPMSSNVNIAGFCKELLNLNTGFSGIHFYRSHMESIWTLGRAIGTAVSFDQCQFQFYPPSTEIYAPPFLLYAVNPVSFRDCVLEYFSNCTYKMPFIINAPAVSISGGSIEGGPLFAGGYSNAGGEAMHRVKYDNVKINCLGKIAGKKTSAVPLSNLDGQIIMGGEMLTSNDGKMLVYNQTTFQVDGLEKATITINEKTKKGIIKTANPKLYKIGDVLFPEAANVDPALCKMSVGNAVNFSFGYVSAITNNEVEITGIPQGVTSGAHYLYKASFPIFKVGEKNQNISEYQLKN
jgi:hypothetical protein